MKKVAILTIIDYYNIGNRLQNYAVQEILKKLGVRPETIRKYSAAPERFKHFLRKHFMRNWSSGSRFFSDQFIQWSRYAQYDFPPPADSYDYFIVGSDQVWNPYFCDKCRKRLFFLDQFPADKKIAFAASIGVDTIPDEWKPWYEEHLSSFKDISVREESGVKIVSELTHGAKKVEVLIDPTCFFDSDEWDNISAPPRQVDIHGQYILTYFLGSRPEQAEQIIREQVQRKGYDVIHISDLFQNKVIFGPGEFVYLISHASLILTDSFHGSVFSFLYKKPFLVYPRSDFLGQSSMMSRIDTFLKGFDLQRKFADSGLENDIFECDYHVGMERLKKEREKMVDFLRSALNL